MSHLVNVQLYLRQSVNSRELTMLSEIVATASISDTMPLTSYK